MVVNKSKLVAVEEQVLKNNVDTTPTEFELLKEIQELQQKRKALKADRIEKSRQWFSFYDNVGNKRLELRDMVKQGKLSPLDAITQYVDFVNSDDAKAVPVELNTEEN